MLGAGSAGHLTQVNAPTYPGTGHRVMTRHASPRRMALLGHHSEQDALRLTIGQLARHAGVGVETISCHERRGLLPLPSSGGAVRLHPTALAQRIRFIKKAQAVGSRSKRSARCSTWPTAATGAGCRR